MFGERGLKSRSEVGLVAVFHQGKDIIVVDLRPFITQCDSFSKILGGLCITFIPELQIR
jgi:hypothetical protein